MLYLKYYAVLSFVIGAIYTIWIIYLNWERVEEKKDSELFLNRKAREGHLQKEVYPDRTVYYRKTNSGDSAVITVEVINKLKEKYKSVYVLMLFVVGTVSMAIEWPKILYHLVKEKPK